MKYFGEQRMKYMYHQHNTIAIVLKTENLKNILLSEKELKKYENIDLIKK